MPDLGKTLGGAPTSDDRSKWDDTENWNDNETWAG